MAMSVVAKGVIVQLSVPISQVSASLHYNLVILFIGGGSEPTGKALCFVRACVHAVWLSSRNGAGKWFWCVGIFPFPFFYRGPFHFPSPGSRNDHFSVNQIETQWIWRNWHQSHWQCQWHLNFTNLGGSAWILKRMSESEKIWIWCESEWIWADLSQSEEIWTTLNQSE